MKKYNPKARRLAREFIVQALYQWQLAEKSLSALKSNVAEGEDFEKCDKEYFAAGVDSILSDVSHWDNLLKPFLDRDLGVLDPVEHAILWLGAYELSEQAQVPSVVAINEAVEVSKLYGATDSHKYINGVLDKLAKQTIAKDS
ncbi:MAG: transcription antitermination factor NusB [Gammaproteobacteria bacterium]